LIDPSVTPCPETPAEKTCTKCGETKPLEAFNRHRRAKDGRQAHCRECFAAYYAANRERTIALSASWRASNGERYATNQAAWYAANRERVAAQNAAWYAANRERAAATDAAYRAANPEREAARQAAWRKANPEKDQEKRSRRRARLLGADATLTAEQWHARLALWNYACAVCGSASDLHMDHIVPLSRGGAHTAENVWPLCARHNLSKGARDLLSWLSSRWRRTIEPS
jgi:5-methylcytosine-specific restriction endonuclease McrA